MNKSNISRSLVDVISQSEKFRDIYNINEVNVDDYNKYSQEIVSFLKENFFDSMILERADKIRIVNYKRAKHSFVIIILSILFLPSFIYERVRDYNRKYKAQSIILENASTFSSIEFLLRSK